MIEPPTLKADPAEWRRMLQSDRPSYVCPNCALPSMQFFAELPDGSGRREVFRCLACDLIREL